MDLNKDVDPIWNLIKYYEGDVKSTLDAVDDIRKNQKRDSAVTDSGAQRFFAAMPNYVMMYFEKKYGQKIFQDKKFRENFYRTFRSLVIPDKW